MKILLLSAISASAIGLSGCATERIPTAELFPHSTQKKLLATKHWNIVARDVAAQIQSVANNHGLIATRPVFVVSRDNGSTFDRLFQDFVTTELVAIGMHVATTRAGNAYEVKLDTALVRHGSSRERPYQPGTMTALAAGVAVARNISLHMSGDHRGLASFALLGALDASTALVGEAATNVEVVVTTSLISGGRYITRRSGIYYVEDADLALFIPAKRHIVPVRHFEVTQQ